MTNYAVLHVSRLSKFEGFDRHLKRSYIAKNIDTSRSHLNEEMVPPKNLCLIDDLEQRISQGYKSKRAIRKDAVKGLAVIMTGTHERMKELEKDQNLFQGWKKENYKFACKEWGKENIVRFTLHRDEKTPHIHCVFTPLTPNGRLCAREITGNSEKLRNLQNKYAKAMAPFGLERGISAELTGRQHLTVAEYQRGENILYQKAQEKAHEIIKENPKKDKLQERVTRELASGYVREQDLTTKHKHLATTLESIMHRKTQKREHTIDYGKSKDRDLDLEMD